MQPRLGHPGDINITEQRIHRDHSTNRREGEKRETQTERERERERVSEQVRESHFPAVLYS